MDQWLHREVTSRLSQQASCWLKGFEQGLIISDYVLDSADMASLPKASWKQSKPSSLPSFVPEPTYDVFWVHLLPETVEEQELLWQMLSCVACDGAAVFFSAWGAGTADLLGFSFLDFHVMGDLLSESGWQDAVMSSQRFSVTYEHAAALEHDLSCLSSQKTEIAQAISEQLINEQGAVVLNYELAMGHSVFSRDALNRKMGIHHISPDQIKRPSK